MKNVYIICFVPGFSAEDVAMMSGQHACVQLISDHSNKLRRSLGGSIPSTPRTPLAQTPMQTPRTEESVTENFGIPQMAQNMEGNVVKFTFCEKQKCCKIQYSVKTEML